MYSSLLGQPWLDGLAQWILKWANWVRFLLRLGWLNRNVWELYPVMPSGRAVFTITKFFAIPNSLFYMLSNTGVSDNKRVSFNGAM